MAYGQPRDSQKSKVYAWERKIRSIHPELKTTYSIEFLQKVADKVCDRYNVPRIPLRMQRGKDGGTAHYWWSYEISFSKSSCTMMILLHELAHAICDVKLKEKNHSPTFVRWAMELYVEYLNLDFLKMKKLATENDVFCSSSSACKIGE